MSISYGYDVSETQADPLVRLAESTMDKFSVVVAPGAFLVDFLPWRGSFSLTFIIQLTNYTNSSEVHPCMSPRDEISEKCIDMAEGRGKYAGVALPIY